MKFIDKLLFVMLRLQTS